MRTVRAWMGLVALAAGMAAPASGQVLTGRILDQSGAGPVEGALVVLLAADSTRLGAVLSGPDGRYSVRLPAGDAFRLRIERIGYATVVTPVIERGRAARAPVDVRTPVEAVSLEPIVATGAGRCVVDPRTALETATLWEHARKTLEVTALVQREGLLHFRAVWYARRLDVDRTVLLDETLRTGVMSRPFRSLPADLLHREGWVQQDGDSSVYHMPDPEVALSDAFLDEHCFHVAERAGPGGREVGLAFGPLQDRRLPDVSGVLWLDGRSGELRSLEYGYTGLAPDEAGEVAGGRAEFERLPTGAWVVRRWSITMPVLAERKRFLGLLPRVVVAELREEGGELLEVRDGAGRPLALAGAHDVTGEVRDVDGGRPLATAVVRLSGTLRQEVTGKEGRFRFEGLPGGAYLLTFTHPLLDTLGVRAGAWPVDVPGEAAGLVLETPSRAEVRAEACPAMRPEWRSGVLSGRVVDAPTGSAVADAEVTMRFTGPRGRARSLDARTDPDGWYRFCAVIQDRPLLLQAQDGERRSPEVTVTVPEAGFSLAHLRIGG